MKKLILLSVLFSLGLHLSAKDLPKRALRGVWVATVANIDWPSKRGLPVEQQQKEMVAMLDRLHACNINTVIFQVRPTADALYKSKLEPSSHWITGKQGAEMEYDPLQFVIDECDKRGMLVHAWINPYRVVGDTAMLTNYDKNHIINKHPDWIVTYDKGKYFNPGLEEVRAYVCSVVKDIATNYNVDAIHMDDYFYPYKVKDKEFPDAETFKKYPRGFKEIGDWRRNNVNLIIEEINHTIKSVKPWLEFGISPFAVWRNKSEDPERGSDSKAMTNYDGLYADVLLWQEKGWIDHVLPQLYFNIGYQVADYATLADWWAKYNYGANIYAGLGPYKISKDSKQKEWHTYKEIVRQIKRNATDPNLKGEVYFSVKSLFKNPELEKYLSKEAYKTIALSPENNRVARVEAENPSEISMSILSDNRLQLKWKRGKNARRFVVYRFPVNKPINIDNPEYMEAVTGQTEIILPWKGEKDLKKYRYAVSSLSPSHSESAIVFVNK